MRIGLTYDLREDYLELGFAEEDVAEFDSPRTIEAIEGTLNGLGFETERIGHVRSLVETLAAGRRWDMVFNIAEGVDGFGREAAVPSLLEAYGLPYTFSDPLTLTVTLHKGMAKRVVRDLGLATPDFAVIESAAQAESVDLPFPLFAKPVAEGTGKGITAASRIDDRAELVQVCAGLIEKYRQPVLVETFLPGREFTVGLVGSGLEAEVVGVLEVDVRDGTNSAIYSYHNKENCEELVVYRLADDDQARQAAALALDVWRGLRCRDAGRVDVRADALGRPHFLEVNPLAGLHPEHSDLPILCGLAGYSYPWLIGRIMASALSRANLAWEPFTSAMAAGLRRVA